VGKFPLSRIANANRLGTQWHKRVPETVSEVSVANRTSEDGTDSAAHGLPCEHMVTAESVRHGVLLNGVAVGMSCEWDISSLLRINGEDYDEIHLMCYMKYFMANDIYIYILYIVCSVYYITISSVYVC